MFPKTAKPARAIGLPKIHEKYTDLPKFRPAIDTIGSPLYNLSTFLANLLSPQTCNEFKLNDSSDYTERIRKIPTDLFTDEFKFFSFDVVSLPLKGSVSFGVLIWSSCEPVRLKHDICIL